MKVLVVEDDTFTSAMISKALTSHRYSVTTAEDGEMGLDLAIADEYDLIVLDWLTPKMDGMTVCRELRNRGDKTPILMLTSKDSSSDIIEGLDAGADDYLTKPFQVSVLMARLRALTRRGDLTQTTPALMWGDLTLDTKSADVMFGGELMSLTPKEYRLLELFLRHPRRVFSRSNIIEKIWVLEDSPTENAVTNLIKDLRRKLKDAGVDPEIIETVYGLGYRLKAPPESA